MKILAVECSATPASAAIIEDGKIIASSFSNIKLTHSQTLLPMVNLSLQNARLSFDDIDALAVAAGPGSFTGVRIGISLIKGLAAPKSLPCAGVSTLYAMAQSFKSFECVVCAVMDARCNQVYNALFEIKDGKITRLCEDRALMCDELAAEISANYFDKNVIVTGDGADLFYPFVEDLKNTSKALEPLKYQSAVGVCLAAEEEIKSGNTVTADGLLPIYLRLPQAERELKEKQKRSTEK